jgi:citrate lyase synthetase
MENKNVYLFWKNISTQRFKDRGFKSKDSALEFLNFMDKNVKDFNNSP